jgi:hypothetical protein
VDDVDGAVQGTAVGLQELTGLLLDAATSELGDRYVEMWLTEGQDHFVVGVHDLQDGEAEALQAELGLVAPTEVVNRQVSRAELDEVALAVSAAAEAQGGVVSVVRNCERGVVRLVVPESVSASSLADEIAATGQVTAVTGDAVDGLETLFDFDIAGSQPKVAIVHGAAPSPMDTYLSAPMKSGKYITVTGSQHSLHCTSGFLVSGGGGTYGITAGHCGQVGSSVKLGTASSSLTQGNIQNNTYWGNGNPVGDSAVFIIGGSGADASVFVNSSLSRTLVSQAQAAPAPALYGRACFSGTTTLQESCGNVTATGVSFTNQQHYDGSHNISGLVEWQSDAAQAVQGGDSGSGIYAVNADGTAVALGLIQSGYGQDDPQTSRDDRKFGYFTPIGTATSMTGTSIIANGRAPFGWLDLAQGGNGTVRVRGWALDPDKSREAIDVHVYVGGVSGSGEGHAFTANGYRPDVQSAYPNTGENHGFDVTFSTSRRGTIPVYVYAINASQSGGGNAHLSGSPLTVTVN